MAAYTEQEIQDALGPAHTDPAREAVRLALVKGALEANKGMQPGAPASMMLAGVRAAIDGASAPADIMAGQQPLPLAASGGCCKGH